MAKTLALFAHPDDESWAAGGLIARRGGVHVVTFTAGEAGFGEVARRPTELAAACAVLGATHELVGLPDGRVSVAAVVEALAPILAHHAPSEIIGFDPTGGYGHIDHVALVRGTLAAIAGMPRRPTVLGAVFPTGLLEPLRDRIVPYGFIHPDYVRGALALPPHLIVDLSPSEIDLKRRALACHRSQLPRGVDHFLDRGVFAALATRERYRHL